MELIGKFSDYLFLEAGNLKKVEPEAMKSYLSSLKVVLQTTFKTTIFKDD
jgi:hypothetical protein